LEVLNAAAAFVEYDGMKIDLTVPRGLQLKTCRPLINRDFIAQIFEGMLSPIRTFELDDNIEVIVFPRLLLQ
jgi:hypothetical protein